MSSNLGVYVHIPYCQSICSYCSYNVLIKDSTLNKYIIELNKEIKDRSKDMKEYVVDTVHIGGGTPSLLNLTHIKTIIATIKNCFDVSEDLSIAMEVNPEDLSEENSVEYKKLGINRIVVGVQSMIDKDLKNIGRAHTAKVAIDGINIVKKHIENVGVDILRDISTTDNFKSSLDHCIDLGVEHISIYDLEGVDSTEYIWTTNYLKTKGYVQYHMTSYSKDGKYPSKHGIKYWTDKDYIGVGIGAYSRIKNKRVSNTTSIKDYLNKNITSHMEELDYLDRVIELVIMGLGYNKGIDLSYVYETYNVDLFNLYSKELKYVLDRGYMYIDNDYLKVSAKGQTKINDLELMFYR